MSFQAKQNIISVWIEENPQTKDCLKQLCLRPVWSDQPAHFHENTNSLEEYCVCHPSTPTFYAFGSFYFCATCCKLRACHCQELRESSLENQQPEPFACQFCCPQYWGHGGAIFWNEIDIENLCHRTQYLFMQKYPDYYLQKRDPSVLPPPREVQQLSYHSEVLSDLGYIICGPRHSHWEQRTVPLTRRLVLPIVEAPEPPLFPSPGSISSEEIASCGVPDCDFCPLKNEGSKTCDCPYHTDDDSDVSSLCLDSFVQNDCNQESPTSLDSPVDSVSTSLSLPMCWCPVDNPVLYPLCVETTKKNGLHCGYCKKPRFCNCTGIQVCIYCTPEYYRDLHPDLLNFLDQYESSDDDYSETDDEMSLDFELFPFEREADFIERIHGVPSSTTLPSNMGASNTSSLDSEPMDIDIDSLPPSPPPLVSAFTSSSSSSMSLDSIKTEDSPGHSPVEAVPCRSSWDPSYNPKFPTGSCTCIHCNQVVASLLSSFYASSNAQRTSHMLGEPPVMNPNMTPAIKQQENTLPGDTGLHDQEGFGTYGRFIPLNTRSLVSRRDNQVSLIQYTLLTE